MKRREVLTMIIAALLLAMSLIPLNAHAQTTHTLANTTTQAQPAPVDPSFQLVRGLPDTCSAEANDEFRFETLNNVTFGSGSNQATLNVEGVGEVATFAGNHNQSDVYPSVGDGYYDMLIAQPYDVPAGSTVTMEIMTYTGLNQSGQIAYRSTLAYNCDTGESASLTNERLLEDPNAQPGNVADLPPVDPAFELSQGVPDTCSVPANEELRFDTLNNVSFGSGSNAASLSVEGVGQVASFAGNHNQSDIYPSIGNGFYDLIVTDGYEVSPGTTVTMTITTYTGLNQSGQLAYRSTLTYECDLAEAFDVTNENLLADAAQQPATVANIPDVDPAFVLTEGAPNTCTVDAGDIIRFQTVNNVTFGNGSNQAILNVDGIGEVARFGDNHDQADAYPSIGDGFYDIGVDDTYSVPTGTAITMTIATYSGLNQSGQPVYRSTLSYNCETGEVISSSSGGAQ